MTDPVVSTEWLAARLGDPRTLVIDATWFMPGDARDARAEFGERHIPGAVFFGIDDIRDRASPLPHMLPPADAFGAAARALGVRRDSRIVVYDTLGLFSAPRVWWTFRAMGHASTFVLDGGLPRWLAEDRPVESGVTTPSPGDFVACPAPALVSNLEAVREASAHGSPQIVDARPAARFAGAAPEPRAGLRSGHMPGARNLPWGELVTADGALADSTALRRAFADAGVDLAAPIITTCGSGVSASVLALALARLGRADAAVYDGSWSEWGARADTPVVTG